MDHRTHRPSGSDDQRRLHIEIARDELVAGSRPVALNRPFKGPHELAVLAAETELAANAQTRTWGMGVKVRELSRSEPKIGWNQAGAPKARDHPTDFPSIFEERGSNILKEGEPFVTTIRIS